MSELGEPEEYFQVGQRENRLVVYLRYPLFKALDEFTTRDSHREQAGLLVGRCGQRGDGTPYVLIEDAIEASPGTAGCLDEGLWKKAKRIASARHPTRQIVGWFHGHGSSEVNPTSDESTVHQRHFTEPYQLLYRIDPKAKDRAFYFKEGATLKAVSGFAIYGKPAGDPSTSDASAEPPVKAASSSSPVPPQPLTPHIAPVDPTQAYLERSVEKILRRLQRPPISRKDWLIMALLVANLVLLVFRPTPMAKVDTSTIERSQVELSSQIAEVRDRIGKLEQHLADLQLLDKQIKLAAGEEPDELDTAATPVNTSMSPSATPDATGGATVSATPEALSGGEAKVKLYTVVKHDTLSGIVARSYPGAGPDVTAAFARYNRLKGPDFNIFEGDVLKIPEEKALYSKG